MYLSYINMYYSPIWCLKSIDQVAPMKGISLQFNTVPRSQLGNFSYKLRMLSTPNGVNYLVSICILQFELFQVKLPLQYIELLCVLYFPTPESHRGIYFKYTILLLLRLFFQLRIQDLRIKSITDVNGVRGCIRRDP